jgi:hypothetical protein
MPVVRRFPYSAPTPCAYQLLDRNAPNEMPRRCSAHCSTSSTLPPQHRSTRPMPGSTSPSDASATAPGSQISTAKGISLSPAPTSSWLIEKGHREAKTAQRKTPLRASALRKRHAASARRDHRTGSVARTTIERSHSRPPAPALRPAVGRGALIPRSNASASAKRATSGLQRPGRPGGRRHICGSPCHQRQRIGRASAISTSCSPPATP